MRKVAFIILSLCLTACNAQTRHVQSHDYIVVNKHAYCDSVTIDSLRLVLSSYKAQIDSLNKVIAQPKKVSQNEFTYGFKYERIKYYYNICQKRPANKKYFYGWVSRVIKSK